MTKLTGSCSLKMRRISTIVRSRVNNVIIGDILRLGRMNCAIGVGRMDMETKQVDTPGDIIRNKLNRRWAEGWVWGFICGTLFVMGLVVLTVTGV